MEQNELPMSFWSLTNSPVHPEPALRFASSSHVVDSFLDTAEGVVSREIGSHWPRI